MPESHLVLCPILIVDDNDFNRMVLRELFVGRGFKNVEVATNGKDALSKMNEFKPELVVLDLEMPEMDGYEFCQAIRKTSSYKHLPVLVQSAHGDSKSIVKAFEAGATDFVTKPVLADEVMARVRLLLDNRRMMEELRHYRKTIEEHLDIARTMQSMIVPSTEQLELLRFSHRLDIAAYFEPSEKIGGDFWGVQAVSENLCYMYLIDFSGHSISAAINTFRAQVILRELLQKGESPEKVMAEFNQRVCEIIPVGQFATVFLARIDIKSKVMSYATAGATPCIVKRLDLSLEILENKGLPLGIERGVDYPCYETPFNEGDMIFSYSDALVETPGKDGKFIDEQQLQRFIQKSENYRPKQLLKETLKMFGEHHADRALSDDLTLVYVYFMSDKDAKKRP